MQRPRRASRPQRPPYPQLQSPRRPSISARSCWVFSYHRKLRKPDMATTTSYGRPTALPLAALPVTHPPRRPPPFRVALASSTTRGAPAPRLRVSCGRRRAAGAACFSEANLEAAASPAEANIDLKLPRRSLLVQFTCDACGERTKRLINRVAYERGTVFLQCAGCQAYHKFVDNLGLVVEYDLREENGVNRNTED